MERGLLVRETMPLFFLLSRDDTCPWRISLLEHLSLYNPSYIWEIPVIRALSRNIPKDKFYHVFLF